ncbi:MAG TPA: tRNA lysidine(34) synthetase TilS [Anaerolineae bacterium]
MTRKVRSTIAKHNLFAVGERVVIGVSGGPDSLALLHILTALKDETQIELVAAHLNHQLRGADSDADAEFVRRIAQEWGIRSAIGAVDVQAHARENRMSLEEAGRVARYAFLASIAQQVEAKTVAVAHNADDQVETILMHFIRGSGLAGLRGMLYTAPSPLTGEIGELREGEPLTAQFPTLRLVRPLLDITRAEIEAYCTAQALDPRRDKTNLDQTLFRNRLRHETIPYLEKLNPNIRQVLRRTALAIADDYSLIRDNITHAFYLCASIKEGAILFRRETWVKLHPSLQRGTLREAIRYLRPQARNINWDHIEQARRVGLEGETGAQATLPLALELTVRYDEFVIAPVNFAAEAEHPLLNADRAELRVPGETLLPANSWTVQVSLERKADSTPVSDGQWQAVFDADKIRGVLYLRKREPGDKFQPSGMGGHTKSLHEFMIDEKIPQNTRDKLPILCDEEKVVWVCGWRVDERVCVSDSTRYVLRVRFVAHVYRDHHLE